MSEHIGNIGEALRRVTVQVDCQSHGHGSGILWNDKGLILTNAHVATVDTPTIRFWNGESKTARILRRDARRDIALLDTCDSHPIAAPAWTDSAQLQPGDTVIAVGNPLGFIGAVSVGRIERQGIIPQIHPLPWIQSAIRLAPGNSGGALADSDGRIVGINTMVAGQLGLSIPSNDAARFVERALRTPPPPALGVAVETLPIQRNRQPAVGLRIQTISPGSKAEFASLLPGDVIIGVDGKMLRSPQDLMDRLEHGGLLHLEFVRGGRPVPREVSIALGRLSNAA
jgi:serine protease Do